MAKSRQELAEQAKLQKHHLYATITQLKIHSMQASIAAEEMESLKNNEWARERYADNIRKIVEKMNRAIEELERKTSRD